MPHDWPVPVRKWVVAVAVAACFLALYLCGKR
jgi:hypothetical protein